jgi:hypothetical protein
LVELVSNLGEPNPSQSIPKLNGITIHHLTSLYLIPSAFGGERIITEQLEGGGKLVFNVISTPITKEVGSTC